MKVQIERGSEKEKKISSAMKRYMYHYLLQNGLLKILKWLLHSLLTEGSMQSDY